MTSLVSGSEPFETQATNAAPALLLASNTYYWSVTPLDAKGHPGEPSETRSFTWEWPSSTTPAVEDVAPQSELYVPKFSWDPIPGAARYEVEVNSVSSFPSGPSKVCCSTSDIPITTTFIPKETFPNNTYYWRVRALNAEGEAGEWNEGPSFTKSFDNFPLLDEDAIKNLRMRDTADPGTDLDGGTAGYQTDLPIVTGDPVPGASAYQVFVVPFQSGVCNVGASSSVRWLVRTATTSWTPLGSGSLASKPFPSGPSVSKDTPGLIPGQAYCVQVRARSGRVNLSEDVWGDFTVLDDGTGASFTFTDFPTGGACSPSCNANYLGHDDYLLPIRGETTTANPLFMWNPIAGKSSYWVIVAKDPVVYEHRRLRLHADPGLRGEDRQLAENVSGRDDLVLLGRPPRHRHQRKRRAGSSVAGRLRRLREAGGCPDVARSGQRRGVYPGLRPSRGSRLPVQRGTASRWPANPPSPRTPCWTR